MVIDCRTWSETLAPEEWAGKRMRCFVDGVEIQQVFYVDTEAGFVRTYDVLGDNKPHLTHDLVLESLLNSEEWNMPINGVVSKYVRGRVELKPFEEAVK